MNQCNLCGEVSQNYTCTKCIRNPYISPRFNKYPIYSLGDLRVEIRHPKDDNHKAGLPVEFYEIGGKEYSQWIYLLQYRCKKKGLNFIKEVYYTYS